MRTCKSDLIWSVKLNQPIPPIVFDRNFSEKSVKNINQVIGYTRAKIVITSTWRNKLSLNDLRRLFRKQGIRGDIIDVTDNLTNRGEEIQDWIDAYNVTNFVVIDDQVGDILRYIPKRNVIKIDPNEGFDDDKVVDLVLDILL